MDVKVDEGKRHTMCVPQDRETANNAADLRICGAMTDQTRRRPFLLDEGETILLSDSALQVVTRRRKFMEATGLTLDEIYVDPVLALPVPIYPKEWSPGTRRWPGVNPQAMWHPLMWFPARLRARYTEGEYEEPDDSWGMRVLLEMSAAGMYDPGSGTWVDILYHYGLDIDDPITLDRVQDWLDGEPDPILDGIESDVETIFDSGDPARAWRTINGVPEEDEGIGSLVRGAEWSLIAQDLARLADSLRADLTDGLAPEIAAQRASTVCWLGDWMLRGALDGPTEMAIFPGGWTNLLVDADDLARSPGVPADEVTGLLDVITALTTPAIETYQPVARALIVALGGTED
jgi:hypothetical protein